MTSDVNNQEIVATEQKQEDKSQNSFSEKSRDNFRRLEMAKEEQRLRAEKAEIEASLLKQRLDDIERRLQPAEKDPMDGVEDYVDPARHKASLTQLEKRLKKEAEEIADKKFRELKDREDIEYRKRSFKNEYRDYDDIVNEDNLVKLEQANPTFLKAVLQVNDEYEKKALAYEYIKNNVLKKNEPKASIKEKVEENAKNPYFIPQGSGTSTAVDFDIKSPQARQEAYKKLQAAQRRPLGSSGFAPQR